MATKMVLPMLGQTMEEGTITKWFKTEGDQVTKGDALLEVMTDKVNMEVEAPESGILRKILAQTDEVVPILAPIAIIGGADEAIDDLLAGDAITEVKVESVVTVTETITVPTVTLPPVSSEKIFISPRARKAARESAVDISALAGRGTGPNGRVVESDVAKYIAEMMKSATPLAAKIAEDKGIDINVLMGTGRGGKITRDDVLQACVPVPSKARVIPFAGIRKLVADNVAKSAQTAPHVTLTAEIDMTEAVRLRGQIVDAFEAKYGVRFTFTHLIIKAAAEALLDHPILNASLQGNEIRISDEVNMGVAVPLEDGLIVPVIHNAHRKSIAEIAVELKGLVLRAKSGTLASSEITGGTFSISNLGAYGIDVFNPIISPGQSAILGVCRIVEKPAVVNGQVEIRSMMNLCLSFDHRVMDGAPAAQFLKTLRELLESPCQMLV